ncbi:hypothetical protein DFQ26_009648 [Actinomortierella ambigua]|nr:hypothetical protein DFQ26_009648 [Actinomortierella ambigua]
MGSSTTLHGLAPGRTIQRDLEVALGPHPNQLQLPLQLQLGLQYRVPLTSSGHRTVYFPVDLVVLDHLHFAEPVVIGQEEEEGEGEDDDVMMVEKEGNVKEGGENGEVEKRWPTKMDVEALGFRQHCTCAGSASSSIAREGGRKKDDHHDEKEEKDEEIYRWIERSPDQQLYFLLDPPSLDEDDDRVSTGVTTIGFDNCLSMLLGDYISAPDRLTGMLVSAETAYVAIPSCGTIAEPQPLLLSDEGTNQKNNDPIATTTSSSSNRSTGIGRSAWNAQGLCTTSTATTTTTTMIPKTTTARIQLALVDTTEAGNRDRAQRWAAAAGEDRLQVCLTVSEAADRGMLSAWMKMHLVNALERRICELMMP